MDTKIVLTGILKSDDLNNINGLGEVIANKWIETFNILILLNRLKTY